MVAPGPILMPGPFPLPQLTLLTTWMRSEFGPMSNPKLQMTSSAWAVAQLSSAGWDRPAGTLTPS